MVEDECKELTGSERSYCSSRGLCVVEEEEKRDKIQDVFSKNTKSLLF